jgi:putative addiction module antidote
MTVKARIRQQGGSLTITLPKEMTDRFQLKAGDEVDLVASADGIHVRPHDAQFEEAMRIAEYVSRKYRNALRTLADS